MSDNRSMNRMGRNIRLILRSERLIAGRQMDAIIKQTGLMAFAGLIAVMGLVMLNLAAFFALQSSFPAYGAALIVAGADFVLVFLLAQIASRQAPGSELEPANEMRDLAVAELEADLDETVTEVRGIAQDVRRMAQDPLGSVLPSLIGPLLGMLLKGSKKKDD